MWFRFSCLFGQAPFQFKDYTLLSRAIVLLRSSVGVINVEPASDVVMSNCLGSFCLKSFTNEVH